MARQYAGELVGRDEGELFSGRIFEPNAKDEWTIGELKQVPRKQQM